MLRQAALIMLTAYLPIAPIENGLHVHLNLQSAKTWSICDSKADTLHHNDYLNRSPIDLMRVTTTEEKSACSPVIRWVAPVAITIGFGGVFYLIYTARGR